MRLSDADDPKNSAATLAPILRIPPKGEVLLRVFEVFDALDAFVFFADDAGAVDRERPLKRFDLRLILPIPSPVLLFDHI